MSRSEDHVPPEYKTKWTSYEQLKACGWKKSSKRQEKKINEDEIAHAQPVIEALGLLPLTDKSWKLVHWIHKKAVTIKVGERKQYYPPTKAYHRALYNPSHGTIIALKADLAFNSSPDLLFRWSDITFLTYMRIWENQPRGRRSRSRPPLKYILQVNVVAQDAISILSRITGKMELRDYRKPFPGDSIHDVPRSEAARACVGVSSGRGVAWLLVQHKETFGQARQITEIQFWDSDEGKGPQGEQLRGLQGIPNVLYTMN